MTISPTSSVSFLPSTGAPTPEASTAPSSPPHASTEYQSEDEEMQRRLSRLNFVLQRSAVYSSILKQRMDEEKNKQLEMQAQNAGKKRGRTNNNNTRSSPRGKRKKGNKGDPIDVEEEAEQEAGDLPIFQQPELITGAKLKPYQLEGLQWMVSLDQNGISGILADEMGLGKTLQTISFSAYLREHQNFRPFLIVCPLSVLHNWVDEYGKFAPQIPVVMYHGSPAERAELRRTVMAIPGTRSKTTKKAPVKPKTKRKVGRPSKAKGKSTVESSNASLRRSGRARKSTVILESDTEEDEQEMKVEDEGEEEGEEEEAREPDSGEYTAKFPVVLTTYEMIIKDRTHLAHYNWGYIVVDEGHRLKNLDCKLMKEIKRYSSAGRMILTGTPLHNNLGELWSLLNFILPDIFDDIDAFQQWFNLPELQSALPTDQSTQIISSLHAILKPFLLRRLKVDVETNLPPKKEYVLYAPLSIRQREAYDRVLDGGLRKWLIQGGTAAEGAKESSKEGEEEIDLKATDEQVKDTKDGKNTRRASTRKAARGKKSYAVDGDDEEYFEMLERGELDEHGVKLKQTKDEEAEERARLGREYQAKAKARQVNNMKLQNTVMQLRKVCSHPFLFDWPIDPTTMEPILGEELVNASGKMMVLDRLLRALFERKHKVLLFSQFTTMLDIIEDWAVDYMKWPICRIDGSTPPLERREQMNRFQNGGDDPSAPCLFLLSTRAGGLGINLVAADTVIFYDQDWNPQMDAQAQDRAHRIGQKKPVLIYRLVSAHTIETKIMQRATQKKKLEALVIAKGKFRAPAAAAANNKRETMAEMAASLLRLEGEKIDVVPNTKEGKQGVLSDEDLELLLDRSPAVFAERGLGWTSGAARVSGGGGGGAEAHDETVLKGVGKKAAFAVYEAPHSEGNDALAKMFGEEEAE
ncbi:SNF2 family DNA-dependent ATPase [Agrocybe pediades]|nr:SNF2 family DNA-dependent ATPase [Agrocybe pediades]